MDKESVERFWSSRETLDVDDPCHYMNRWMDKYIYESRTEALLKIKHIFQNARTITDIGCGTGTFTSFIAKLTDGTVTGFDRKKFIQRARDRFGEQTNLFFTTGLVPSQLINISVQTSDVVTLFTVYNHLVIEDRSSLLEYFSRMRQGSQVVMITYWMDEIPDYQKNLSYKDIQTKQELIQSFRAAGLELKQTVLVNRADSKLFWKLGKNWFSYLLTKLLDKSPVFKPTYSVVIFEKI